MTFILVLLKDRIIFLGLRSMDDVANLRHRPDAFLESEDPTRTCIFISIYAGGVGDFGLAIYDTMQYIRPKVATTCMGQAPA